jgi:DNA modification methylase
MTPYYEQDGITIYHGDCLDTLSAMKDSGLLVSCVFTDPPYCSGAHESAKRTKRAAMTPESITARPIIDSDSMGTLGYEWITRRWFWYARRLVVPGGHLACFTDWRMSPSVQLMLETAGWRLTNCVVWNKGYPGLGSGFRAQHELVIIASNGQPQWYSYDFGNVITVMRLTDTDHPHEKPIELLEKLLLTCTPTNGVVLDPFMGSGTTLAAAKRLGRKAIGIEVEERYCEIAATRLAQGALDLFGGRPSRMIRQRIVCPCCLVPFTRTIAGEQPQQGPCGWYYPPAQADWCAECRIGVRWFPGESDGTLLKNHGESAV